MKILFSKDIDKYNELKSFDNFAYCELFDITNIFLSLTKVFIKMFEKHYLVFPFDLYKSKVYNNLNTIKIHINELDEYKLLCDDLSAGIETYENYYNNNFIRTYEEE